jgi:23S rRNA pseudouridine1911/1915/1917 synthase
MKIKSSGENTLVNLLIEEFKTSSRSKIKKLILRGTITLNGKVVTNPVQKISTGDVVEYVKYHAPLNTQDAPFPVLYEDEDLIAVVKPAGLLTYGEKGTTGTSLYRMINDFLRDRSRGNEKIYVCHRLDREVSGILVFAKSEEIQDEIKERWKETEKRYYALVEGKPPEKEGKIESWLKENKAQKVYSTREGPDAKFAVTHYKVMRELPEHTLLEIRIETGRKHQIRVHLSDLGCPIAGDWKYGASRKIQKHIRLHAFYFSMKHPVTGEQLEFKTQMPRGFLSV